MGYCFGCGMLSDTRNGFCGQCLADERTRVHDEREKRLAKACLKWREKRKRKGRRADP